MQPLDPESWEALVQSEDYDMESAIFEFLQVREAENFGLKAYKDSCYKGELLNGKRHGLGVCIYKTQRLYEGQWLNDNRNGRGMERYSNGNKYEGEFKNNKPHGKGVYTWLNGEVYEGPWWFNKKGT